MAILGRTKQEVVSEFRRSEILEAARRVFADRGFADTTVDDVAAAAGIAKGTIYLYFKSKREIYLAALRRDLETLHAETKRRMDEARSADEKIRAFIATRVRFCDENRDFFRIYHAEFNNIFVHPSNAHDELKGIYTEQASLLRSVVEELQSRGEVKRMPSDALAFALYDVTRSLIANRIVGWLRGDVENDIEFIFEFVWKGISVRPCP